MTQDTTREFSHRLEVALEGNPHAPPTPHGRQSWLRQALLKEAGRDVSPNTVHKWCRGLARPRPDAMRDLARVLRVDEIWLAMGRKPGDAAPASTSTGDAAATPAAGLILAGLIEPGGGRVSFPAPSDGAVTIWANVASRRVGVIATSPQPGEADPAFIIPEPAEGHTIVGVLVGEGDDATARVDLLDLTETPRDNFGGFSIVKLERRKDRAFKVPGQRVLLRPLACVADLAGARE